VAGLESLQLEIGARDDIGLIGEFAANLVLLPLCDQEGRFESLGFRIIAFCRPWFWYFGSVPDEASGGDAEALGTEYCPPRSSLVMIFGCFVEFNFCSRNFRATSAIDSAGCGGSRDCAGAPSASARTVMVNEHAQDTPNGCHPKSSEGSLVLRHRLARSSRQSANLIVMRLRGVFRIFALAV